MHKVKGNMFYISIEYFTRLTYDVGSFAGDHSEYTTHVTSFNIHCTGNRLHLRTSQEKEITVIRNVVSQAHSKLNSRI